MKLSEYIEKTNQAPMEGGVLSFSNVPSKRQLITTKRGRESLPYWYGIKPIRFIWRGSWADPHICYNRMVVNAHDVDEVMYGRYQEYCQDEELEISYEGFGEYMRNNKAEVVEIIYWTHNAENNEYNQHYVK